MGGAENTQLKIVYYLAVKAAEPPCVHASLKPQPAPAGRGACQEDEY